MVFSILVIVFGEQHNFRAASGQAVDSNSVNVAIKASAVSDDMTQIETDAADFDRIVDESRRVRDELANIERRWTGKPKTAAILKSVMQTRL
jgi:uncharacterized protein YdcH (DUF465 family)